MTKYLIIITLFVTYGYTSFAMESLPLIMTPYIPVLNSDEEPSTQVYVSNDASMYSKIPPSGVTNTRSQQNESILPFKEQSRNNSILRISNKDSSYNIFSPQDCDINDGNFQLTLFQIKEIRKLILANWNVVVWNGIKRYDISQLASTDQSLTEQCLSTNKKIEEFLETSKQSFIYGNLSARIVEDLTLSPEELEARKDKQFEEFRKIEEPKILAELQAKKRLRLVGITVLGIPILGLLTWLIFSKMRK